jgi:hypothetical protein
MNGWPATASLSKAPVLGVDALTPYERAQQAQQVLLQQPSSATRRAAGAGEVRVRPSCLWRDDCDRRDHGPLGQMCLPDLFVILPDQPRAGGMTGAHWLQSGSKPNEWLCAGSWRAATVGGQAWHFPGARVGGGGHSCAPGVCDASPRQCAARRCTRGIFQSRRSVPAEPEPDVCAQPAVGNVWRLGVCLSGILCSGVRGRCGRRLRWRTSPCVSVAGDPGEPWWVLGPRRTDWWEAPGETGNGSTGVLSVCQTSHIFSCTTVHSFHAEARG